MHGAGDPGRRGGQGVRLVETDAAGDEFDAAYRATYHRHAVSVVDRITRAGARTATLELVPLSQR